MDRKEKETRVYEVVTNLEQRGQFATPQRISQMLPYDSDLYRSYYNYDMEHAGMLAKAKKSVSDYSGSYGLDEVLLDIDGHDNFEASVDKVVGVLDRLIKAYDVPEEHLMVWCSGGGFHIVMPPALFGEPFASGIRLPFTVQATMTHLFPEADNLYYPTALIRVGRSYNTKRRGWKMPVPISMLYNRNIKGIQEIVGAGEMVEVDYDRNVSDPVMEKLVVLGSAAEAILPSQGKRFPLPVASQTSNVVTCMQHLYNRGEQTGSRHVDLLRLVSWWRRSQLHYDLVLDLAHNWASTLEPGHVKKVVDDVFAKDYRYGCNDKVRLQFCDPKCIFYARKNEGDQTFSQGNMDDQMQAYAASDSYLNPVNLGRFYGMHDFYVYPGEYVVLAGDTGLNKTALMQNWAYLVRPKKVIYLSTEVDRILLYRRFVQIAADLSKFEVMDAYKKGAPPDATSLLNHIHIVDEPMEVGDLTRMCLDRKPDVIFVDVLEDLGDQRAKSNDRIDEAARGLKSIAQSMRLICFAVSHISKAAAGMPLDTRSAKGPSSVIQKADKAFGITGNRYDPAGNRKLRTLKARDEIPMDIEMQVDIKNWRFKKI